MLELFRYPVMRQYDRPYKYVVDTQALLNEIRTEILAR